MNRNPFENMSQVLKELLAGILLLGLVIQGGFVWLVSDKWYFTTGLWSGVVLALFMAIHMNCSIEKSLTLSEDDAQGHMQKMTAVRMAVVILVMGAVCFLKLGNGVSLFAGVLTLKFSAYFQPILHRLMEKLRKGR